MAHIWHIYVYIWHIYVYIWHTYGTYMCFRLFMCSVTYLI